MNAAQPSTLPKALPRIRPTSSRAAPDSPSACSTATAPSLAARSSRRARAASRNASGSTPASAEKCRSGSPAHSSEASRPQGPNTAAPVTTTPRFAGDPGRAARASRPVSGCAKTSTLSIPPNPNAFDSAARTRVTGRPTAGTWKQVERRVGLVETRRRHEGLARDHQRRDDGLDGARRAERVSKLTLAAGDGDPSDLAAERAPERRGLHRIVGDGPGAVRVHVVDVARIHARRFPARAR